MGMQIAINSFRITESFPQQEKFGLALQINKAGVSIPSNIAEGSGRISDKDYSRFLKISLGSSFELETQLLIAQKLNYGSSSLIDITLEMLVEEEKMLTSFIHRLSSRASGSK